MQLVFPWAPKLARKCESRHWFPFGADRRSYGHVITKFSRMGRLLHFLTYGAPRTRFAHGWSSVIKTASIVRILGHLETILEVTAEYVATL